MRAMILAAGRGERMRPLTDSTPKPLLPIGGKPLIVWHIERLVAAGITDIVINHAWLGSQIESTLGDGARWQARIAYSAENPALETAGGIARALPLLGESPFLVINGDVWTDWRANDASRLGAAVMRGAADLALLLVANPSHHTEGDFGLGADGALLLDAPHRLTYSGIAVFAPGAFKGIDPNHPAKLRPLLDAAIRAGRATGSMFEGHWTDVGTVQRLAEVNATLIS